MRWRWSTAVGSGALSAVKPLLISEYTLMDAREAYTANTAGLRRAGDHQILIGPIRGVAERRLRRIQLRRGDIGLRATFLGDIGHIAVGHPRAQLHF